MNSREKYEYWLDIAEYDLETARANYISCRYLYVVFMCQQAVEKLIKGLHVLFTGEEADRTHNIARIFNKIFNEDKNAKVINDKQFSKGIPRVHGFLWRIAILLYSGKVPIL